MRRDHRLDRGRDQVALRQNVVHPFALRHAIAGGRYRKFGWRAASRPDPFFDIAGQLSKRFVPRVHIVPGVDDADDRFGNIFISIAHRIHQADIIGFCQVFCIAAPCQFVRLLSLSMNSFNLAWRQFYREENHTGFSQAQRFSFFAEFPIHFIISYTFFISASTTIY